LLEDNAFGRRREPRTVDRGLQTEHVESARSSPRSGPRNESRAPSRMQDEDMPSSPYALRPRSSPPPRVSPPRESPPRTREPEESQPRAQQVGSWRDAKAPSRPPGEGWVSGSGDDGGPSTSPAANAPRRGKSSRVAEYLKRQGLERPSGQSDAKGRKGRGSLAHRRTVPTGHVAAVKAGRKGDWRGELQRTAAAGDKTKESEEQITKAKLT
jgi:hypothetical protein